MDDKGHHQGGRVEGAGCHLQWELLRHQRAPGLPGGERGGRRRGRGGRGGGQALIGPVRRGRARRRRAAPSAVPRRRALTRRTFTLPCRSCHPKPPKQSNITHKVSSVSRPGPGVRLEERGQRPARVTDRFRLT